MVVLYNTQVGDNMTEQEKIIEIINTLKPFLQAEGGDIEFIKYEDNIVYIKMLGACANCEMLDFTLTDGIETAICDEVPSVKRVVNVLN